MSYKILSLPEFVVSLKKLAKKYKNIKQDLQALNKILQNNPRAGTLIQHNCYKIRMANSSIPTGKSGGFRIIYYFTSQNSVIYLVSIYSKTQQDNISDNNILSLLKSHGI
ncbi:MAG: hypothetical protein DRQ51_09880 [Gammaproteobacteria bacterium]|nr:MAG: hypothetical protein DRQ51_09880 [Gammaproteobacteria bacterium]